MLVFVIGAPGSGKGTLCHKLCADFGYSHFSLGDHLRYLLRTMSNTLEQHVIDKIRKSELLPTADLIPILKAAVQQNSANAMLLDGFPRNIEQVKDEQGNVVLQPDLVLFFDCPGDVARERYLTRALLGRDSDPDIFGKRYEEFGKLNEAVLEEYRKQGILVTVDTSTATEASYERLLKALHNFRLGLCSVHDTKGAGQDQQEKDK